MERIPAVIPAPSPEVGQEVDRFGLPFRRNGKGKRLCIQPDCPKQPTSGCVQKRCWRHHESHCMGKPTKKEVD